MHLSYSDSVNICKTERITPFNQPTSPPVILSAAEESRRADVIAVPYDITGVVLRLQILRLRSG